MTWATFKAMVVERAAFHRLSHADLSSTAYGGTTDTRIKLYYGMFCAETLSLYSPKTTLTVALNDLDINLKPSKTTTYSIFTPDLLYVNGRELQKVAFDDLKHLASSQPTPTAGEPLYYAQVAPYRIIFNRPCGAAYSNCYVYGWRDPVYSPDSDSAVLEIPDMDVDCAVAYVCSMLGQGTPADSIGFGVLKQFDDKAYQRASEIRGRNLRAHLPSFSRGAV